MLTYELKKAPGVPLYEALYRCIREDILSGTLAAGEKLPSKRALAQNLEVSKITVETAYNQLLAEGYIRSVEKVGYFVETVEGLHSPPALPQPQPEPARRPRWTTGKHCEGCAFYRATVPSGGHGICKIHKRRVRPQGGKGQNYVLLDEPRQVMARRVACGDWRDKNSREPPQWVGPSAELLRDEIGRGQDPGDGGAT